MDQDLETYDFEIFGIDRDLLKKVLKIYSPGDSRKTYYSRMKIIYELLNQMGMVGSILEQPFSTFMNLSNKIDEIEGNIAYKRKLIGNIKTIFKREILWEDNMDIAARYQVIMTKLSQITNFKNTGKKMDKIFLTEEELKLFTTFFRDRKTGISQVNERNHFAIKIMILTGMRIFGLMDIQIKNINFDKLIIITDEKLTNHNGRDNIYHFVEPFAKELRYYIIKNKLSSNDYLFEVSDKTIRTAVKLLAKETNNERLLIVHPHTFRHNFSTYFSKNETPKHYLERLQNDKITTMIDTFYNLTLQDVDKMTIVYHYFFPYRFLYPNYDWSKWEKKYHQTIKSNHGSKPN